VDPRFEEAFRRARTGDPRAFRTIAETLGPELVRFLTTLLGGDVHAAHDAAQDTLARSWDLLDTIENARHLRRWCYRVGRCKAVSWIRRQAPPGRTLEPLDDVGLDVEQRPVTGRRGLHRTPATAPGPDDLTVALRRALVDLPPNYAGPVHLYYVQGYSTREAAELLGLTRQTVKMRLHRARAYLRRAIHREQAIRGRPREPDRRPRR
jgi:RNA polymerase sigma-70 factor (ECF subfamily)